MSQMNGAESLIRAAVKLGLDVCFANPGTTEVPLVRALDEIPGVRPVLCLFEGYARERRTDTGGWRVGRR
jgi:acetolactate synthase-1/2/3 large subunit